MTGSDYFNQRESEILEELEQADLTAHDALVEIFKAKKSRIQEYAERCAKEVESGKNAELTSKDQISAYISSKMRERKISEGAIAYVREILPKEYKRQYERIEVPITNGSSALVAFEDNLDLKKPVKQMDNLELQDTDDALKDKEAKLKAELAKVRDTRELVYEAATERKLSLPSMRSEVISTPKPEAGDSEFSNVLIEISNCIMEVARKVIEFPPNQADAARYAEAGRVYLSILKPLTDLKFTKDFRGRLETIKTFEEYGKHAAAVKNAIQTPSGSMRPLTREQVGDMAHEVLESAIKMYNVDPLLVALAEHHRKYKEPFIGQRKDNLHDTLSEKA